MTHVCVNRIDLLWDTFIIKMFHLVSGECQKNRHRWSNSRMFVRLIKILACLYGVTLNPNSSLTLAVNLPRGCCSGWHPGITPQQVSVTSDHILAVANLLAVRKCESQYKQWCCHSQMFHKRRGWKTNGLFLHSLGGDSVFTFVFTFAFALFLPQWRHKRKHCDWGKHEMFWKTKTRPWSRTWILLLLLIVRINGTVLVELWRLVAAWTCPGRRSLQWLLYHTLFLPQAVVPKLLPALRDQMPWHVGE